MDSQLTQPAIQEGLKAHVRRLLDRGLAALQSEEGRVDRWVLDGPAGWRMDFTKQLVDEAVWQDLLAMAEEAGWRDALEAQFAGDRINVTEDRAVLHMALRAEEGDAFEVDGQDVVGDVIETRNAMLAFAEDVRQGRYRTADGGRFNHVVNIGIGGSDLGPVMVHEALGPLRQRDGAPLDVRFVSNVDPYHLDEVLNGMDAATTLVVVVSKTFTTQETMANAARARKWLEQSLGEVQAGRHMAAVSSNVAGAGAMGIDASRVFGFGNWVGGRFSLWGPVGLAIALGSGEQAFRELLSGAREMDQHVRKADAVSNVPLHMALIGVWNCNHLGYTSRAVLPYAQALKSWPAYLQQAEMESNGKGVGKDGQALGYQTSPVVWGAAGTNGQHAFHQLLHQGTSIHPMDFVAFKQPMGGDENMHRMLLANAMAQAEAFCVGRTSKEVNDEMMASGATAEQRASIVPHRTFGGGRPSTFMLADALDARALGALIAAHEHKIFIEGVLWGVYSFDQWGVELGKVLANAMLDHGANAEAWTPGTAAIMADLGFR